MEKEFVERMKSRLLIMKKEIITNLEHEQQEISEIMEQENQPQDGADMANNDYDIRNLEALSSQDLKRLRLIESALSRIENGHYGVCLHSGKLIPKERLEAIPYALYTIEAQEERERQRRRGA